MPKVTRCTAKQLIKLLERSGYLLERSKGSHQIYKKSNSVIVIPLHTGDMKIGLLVSIIKQLRISVEEYNTTI